MKCSIVKDLLNLYVDDLCSEENTKFIKKHLETCDECQKKYNELLKEKNKDNKLLENNYDTETIINTDTNADTKSEKLNTTTSAATNKLKPFKKIQKKLIIRYFLNIVLSLIIIFMLVLIGMYTFCVINKEEGTKDITTYMAGRKAKKITEQLLSGDVNTFVDIAISEDTPLTYINNYEDMIKDIKSELEQEYNKKLKNKKFKVKVNNSSYTSDTYNLVREKYINVYIEITTEENTSIYLSYIFDNYDKYKLYYIEADLDKNTNYMKNTIDYIYALIDLKSTGFINHNIIKEKFMSERIDDGYQSREGILKQIITSNDGTNKRLYANLVSLFDKGVSIESCSINNLNYDTNKNQINGNMILIMSDKKDNKWTLIQPVYFSFSTKDYWAGMICKDEDASIIGEIPKNISEKDLKALFR